MKAKHLVITAIQMTILKMNGVKFEWGEIANVVPDVTSILQDAVNLSKDIVTPSRVSEYKKANMTTNVTAFEIVESYIPELKTAMIPLDSKCVEGVTTGKQDILHRPFLPPDYVDEDEASMGSSSSSSCTSAEAEDETWKEIQDAKCTNVVTSNGAKSLIHIISEKDSEHDDKVTTLCFARPRRAIADIGIAKDLMGTPQKFCFRCTQKVWSADIIKLMDK